MSLEDLVLECAPNSELLDRISDLIGDGRILSVRGVSDEPWKSDSSCAELRFYRNGIVYHSFVSQNPTTTTVPVFASSKGATLQPMLTRNYLEFTDAIRLLARFHVEHSNVEAAEAFNWNNALDGSFQDRLNPNAALYAKLSAELSASSTTHYTHADAHHGNILADDGSSQVRCEKPRGYESTLFGKIEPHRGYVIDIEGKQGDIADDLALYILSVITDPNINVESPEETENFLLAYYFVKHNLYCYEQGKESNSDDFQDFKARYDRAKIRNSVRWLGTKINRAQRCSGSDRDYYLQWANNIYREIKRSGHELAIQTVESSEYHELQMM